ncbi:MAG: hypothetical protein MZW92_23035 [Comamonadaceae bacterium]|nr:hypothetical protein [Comamonadaceae bacterium]
MGRETARLDALVRPRLLRHRRARRQGALPRHAWTGWTPRTRWPGTSATPPTATRR